MSVNKMDKPIYGILETSSKVSYGLNNQKKFYPFDKSLPTFYVPTKKPFTPHNYYCFIKYDNNSKGDKYYGIIENYIGEVGNYEAEKEYLKQISRQKWLSNSKLKNLYKNKDNLGFIDLTPDRVDLTKLLTYSIDPPNCFDIDDAISIEKISDVEHKIYIHIADVSSYFNLDHFLESELKNRTESIYLTGEQINMFPDEIVGEYFTLKENKISRAFTLELLISLNKDDCEIVSHKFYKSNISLSKNMSYDEFDKKYKLNKLDEGLTNLYNIGKYLYEKKFSEKIDHYDSHNMVEIFMIISNVISAKEIIDMKYPILRCQDKSYNIKSEIKIDNKIILDDYYNIFKGNSAIYKIYDESKDNSHFKLNEQLYTHFTSPIRRYVDIHVHRLLSNKFCGTKFNVDINDENLDLINSNNKFYKKMGKLSILNKYIFESAEDSLNSEGYIFDIIDNKLKIWIPELKILVTHKIFSDKLKNLHVVEMNDNKIIIENLETKNIITYNILDKIHFKLVFTRNSKKKYQLQI